MKPNWRHLALEAFNLVYTEDGDKKDVNSDILNNAIDLFYKSISSGAEEYWPYIKLADLIEDTKEKTKLYIQAFRTEPNSYSEQYLFNRILKDNPDILDQYL
jgi:hypothetical protein